MINKKKKKNRTVFKLFFMLLALIYFIAFFNWIFDRNIELDIIKHGEVTVKFSTKAVIIRDSYVIRSPFEGERIYLFSDGQRVRKDAGLMYIFTKEHDSVYNRYLELNNTITELKRASIKNVSTIGNDIIWMRTRRDTNMISLYETDNNPMHAGILTEKINLINKDIIKTLYKETKPSVDITLMESELEEIKETLKKNNLYIKAPESGIFSSSTDGFETQSSRDMIASINAQWINDVLSNPIGPKQNPDDIGKLVVSPYYYFNILIDEDIKTQFEGKEHIRVIFPEITDPFYAIIHQIRQMDEGGYMLILRTDRYLEMLINKRYINLDLIIQNVSGISIPTTALQYHSDGTHSIFVSRSGDIICIDVNVIADDRRYAIIESDELSLNDLLVQNPSKAREGMFIK